ncbi:capsule biosynthesis protein [Rubellimicrobium rubrum]|uniref:Capsule biosynthesis protein n=1 Tax=Rubellimicrobium rubrum TaxID=2585369 RepID=A0A5C4N484_9RHOB|nr:capsule biosynthesis protein [Rubellimicrobium rubrum]TNC52406.1 capsule biosynthesis protein [Rubellimicrobium rubrum]
MTLQGPADTPPPSDGSTPANPEAAPADAATPPPPAAEPAPPSRGKNGAPPAKGEPGPVLSLEARRAGRPPQRNGAGGGAGGPGAGARAGAGGGPAVAARSQRQPAPARPPETRPPETRPREDSPPEALAAPRPFPVPAPPARARGRHWAVLVSFVLCVILPTALAAWYLWERATPRYGSEVGFSVRTEEMGSPLDLLGGVAGFGGSSSKDTDILYRFIQSQEIVAAVDRQLDLRALWAKGDPAQDPIFAYHAPGTIEDLHDYWDRMVAVYNDTSTGLLDVQVQAFAPEDAQAIAQAIYLESQALINRLSDIAVADTTRLARQELDLSLERLKTAREALTRFRNETQIVDPSVSIQSQMGLLSSLEAQLAQTLIDLDLLRNGGAPDSDPRVEQALARVQVIQRRMEEERAKLGLGRPVAAGLAAPEGPALSFGGTDDAPETASDAAPEGGDGLAPRNGAAFADLVGEYERLMVDQQFAEQTYVAAMASYDSALAEGRQQTRYLAAHVEPTLAERSDYPRRWTLAGLTALFAVLAWGLVTLGAYALRDRR